MITLHFHLSLQWRRFWWSIECFAAILDSLQTGRIGTRMTECRRGWGAGKEKFFFLSPTLGKLFTSPQLSTVFLFQDGGLNIRWKYISTRPGKIRLHYRLLSPTTAVQYEFHIYSTSFHCTGRYELNKLTSLPM